jgi:hypothetical protein
MAREYSVGVVYIPRCMQNPGRADTQVRPYL